MRLRTIFVACVLVACSSGVTGASSVGGFGGTAAAGPSEGFSPNSSGPTNAATCPVEEPSVGQSCSDLAGLDACEYGAEALTDCDRIYECQRQKNQSGVLQIVWAERPPKTITCATCPADFSDIQEGASCQWVGQVCTDYAGTCGCVASDDAGTTGTWKCAQPAAGCPARRPRVGSRCVHAMTCDYGSCLLNASLSFICVTNGSLVTSWQEIDPGACP
jgi:hypothetical protein